MALPHIEVTKRTVYPPMGIGRKRTVYDARHGLFDATASTAKEARELAGQLRTPSRLLIGKVDYLNKPT